MTETKRLTRTIHDRKIAGVCGGLARYFNVDPSIVRVLYVLLTISSLFLGIIAYIVMAIVVPEEDERMYSESQPKS
ncbi:MAG: PspC domain-containing protein [candidate division KSB1 bacterium]|nr:PspC domain-containing protein [candidate division KSB1 bacterium]MDQ7063131.1 PspC domain-containing protein [candidate division KSB1 bacterium]